MAATDPRKLTDDALTEHCLASATLVRAALAHTAVMLAEFQERGTWAEDGATSAAWVSSRSGELRSEFASLARAGRMLRRFPR